MSLDVLKKIRSKVVASPEITAFYLDKYAKQPEQNIGYKASNNAKDYPFVSYLSVRSELGVTHYDEHIISIIIGVNEKAETEGVFDGVHVLDSLEKLFYQALMVGQLGEDLFCPDSVMRVTNDLRRRHPFYDKEFQFKVQSSGENTHG